MSIEQLQQISQAIDIFLVKARRRERSLVNFQRMLRINERKLIPKVIEWMNWSKAEIATGLNKMRGRTPMARVKSIVDWEDIERQGIVWLKPAMLEILGEGRKAVVERRIIKQERFDPIGMEAVKWATEHSAKLVREVTKETMQAIRPYIVAGINEGKSIDKIARELRSLVGLTEKQMWAVAHYHEKIIIERPEYTAARQKAMADTYARRLHRKRALLIARTETKNALWEGVFQGYGQMGIARVEGVSDPEACEWCKDNIDGKVYSIEEARALDAHPGCECAWVAA